MLLTCNVRGCMKSTEAKLNKDTGDVICSECGNVISGITPYMKRVLEQCGQIIRVTKKKPFMVKCPTCKDMRLPIIKAKKAHCPECDTDLKLTNAFIEQIIIYHGQKDKEID